MITISLEAFTSSWFHYNNYSQVFALNLVESRCFPYNYNQRFLRAYLLGCKGWSSHISNYGQYKSLTSELLKINHINGILLRVKRLIKSLERVSCKKQFPKWMLFMLLYQYAM